MAATVFEKKIKRMPQRYGNNSRKLRFSLQLEREVHFILVPKSLRRDSNAQNACTKSESAE